MSLLRYLKIDIEQALRKWKRKCRGMGIEMNNKNLCTLQFADDQVLTAQDKEDLEYMAQKLKDEYIEFGLNINISIDKSKYLYAQKIK